MKDDFKKRFMDILFEPEDDEVVAHGKMEDVTPKRNEKALSAKDVLYHKADNASAFIDLETKNVFETSIGELNAVMYQKEEKEDDETYEPQPTISPIFGVVRKPNIIEKKAIESEPDESLVKKPEDSHLGTVLSPIYGFGVFDNEEREEEINLTFATNTRSEVPHVENKVENINKDDEVKLVFKEEEKKFENQTLEDILEGFKDKTLVSDREINLFDDLFKEDK